MNDVDMRPDAADDNEQADMNTPETVEGAAGSQPDGNTGVPAGDADTFPREYVESLRKESASYRDRAKTAERQINELQQRLHHSMVADRKLLANPAELAFDPAHLTDPEALDKAINDLLEAKPYLRARPIVGDAGQGNRGDNGKPGVNLLSLMRGGR